MDTRKDIEKILSEINGRYAKEIKGDTAPVAFIAGDRPDLTTAKYYTSGIPVLDKVLGGGFPMGVVTAIHGSPWAGKTSVALTVARELSKEQKFTLYVNLEGIPLKTYEDVIGFDPNYVIEITPRTVAEDILDDIDSLIYDKATKKPKGLLSCVIIDSINNLIPAVKSEKWEAQGAVGIPQMASRAKLLDDLLTRIYGKGMLRDGCIFIVIAQDRANMDGGMYGPATKMSGGESLKFNPKVHLKVARKKNKTKNVPGVGEVSVGHEVEVKTEKNSMAGFLDKGVFTVVYGQGVSDARDLFDKALEYKYIQQPKRGTFTLIMPGLGDYTVKGTEAAIAFISTNSAVTDCFRTVLRAKPDDDPVLTGIAYEPDPVEEEDIEE